LKSLRSLLAVAALLLITGSAAIAQGEPIRLSVDKVRVEPGDDYQLIWIERGGVQAIDDFTIEESADPTFKDTTRGYNKYSVRNHRKSLQNNPSLSHVVRYYRIKAKAWVRNLGDQLQKEDIASNVIRVTLVGTNKAEAVPSFPDDPEPGERKAKKKKEGDDEKKDEYPTMGRPDFMVVKVSTDPERPRVGQKFTLKVFVRNAGVVPSPPAKIRVEAGGRIFAADVEPLKPGYTVPVPLMNMQADAAAFKVRITLDQTAQVTESREDNNVVERTLEFAPDAALEAPKDDPVTGGAQKEDGK